MNTKVYKWCAVPQCRNTSIKTPNKVFVHVPIKKTMRYKWLNLAGRDPAAICINSKIYFCEDHFDLPSEMENYMEYHVMGTVSQVRMKPNCLPTKFECQSDRRKQSSEITDQTQMLKKLKKDLIEECEKYLEERNVITKHLYPETPSGSSALSENIEIIAQENQKTADKSIQVYITHKFRSKAIQTEIKFKNRRSSNIVTCPTTTKPPRIRSLQPKRKINMIEENYDSEILYTSSIMSGESLPSRISLQTKLNSDCRELMLVDKKQEASKILEYTIYKIIKNPHSYIGVPKKCYYLIDLIKESTNIPASDILLCLKKIRLNNTFRELADDFAMTSSYARKIFLKTIPLLVSVMQPFIVELNKDSLKNTLPIAFRHNYHNVSCIIDCLEIVVQKPSKALNQDLTWSEYKTAYTIKYLVSCTPNGLVNYVSPGYGGRITYKSLVESSDFIKCLQPGMCVMANSGFEHAQTYFLKHGVKLVQPSSGATSAKLSKTEGGQNKQMASLRKHMHRVIHHLREFSMLKPHSSVSHNLIKILDDAIIVVSGLINLQDSLMK